MTTTYNFSTDDPTLAEKIMALTKGGSVPVHHAAAHVAPAAPAPVVSVAAPPAPPAAAVAAAVAAAPPPPVVPVAAPPAPPAPPVAAAPPPKPKGTAPEGWTIEHVTSAAKAHAETKGPASLKAVVAKYGEKKATEVDPAQWPNLYADLVAA